MERARFGGLVFAVANVRRLETPVGDQLPPPGEKTKKEKLSSKKTMDEDFYYISFGANSYEYNGQIIWAKIGEEKVPVPHGFGVLSLTTDGEEVFCYRGQWKNFSRHGKGSCLSRGTRFDGHWADDVHHGFGQMKYNDNSLYIGDWSFGVRDGCGQMTHASGDVYRGEWKEGYRQGHGTLFLHAGSVYRGDFTKNLRHGLGHMSYPNGSVYQGHWVHGVREGRGTMLLAHDDIFETHFKANKPHPAGAPDSFASFSSGCRYYGQVDSSGAPHGHGTLLDPKRGLIHVGGFQNGVRVGPGTVSRVRVVGGGRGLDFAGAISAHGASRRSKTSSTPSVPPLLVADKASAHSSSGSRPQSTRGGSRASHRGTTPRESSSGSRTSPRPGSRSASRMSRSGGVSSSALQRSGSTLSAQHTARGTGGSEAAEPPVDSNSSKSLMEAVLKSGGRYGSGGTSPEVALGFITYKSLAEDPKDDSATPKINATADSEEDPATPVIDPERLKPPFSWEGEWVSGVASSPPSAFTM